MNYTIYGDPLRPGYCEVHPDVPEPWPCALCRMRDLMTMPPGREEVDELAARINRISMDYVMRRSDVAPTSWNIANVLITEGWRKVS